MHQQVQKYIQAHHLPTAPARLLVALSGGADSVALALVLKTLGYELKAAHCNFHLRGEESNRDEQFVRQFCEKEEIQLYVQHFDTEKVAHNKGISIEMAARELRYTWFEELRQTTDAEAIAVAHHRDDNAETLLLNLIRGTGIHGLRGMLPKNGQIIRPLLGVSRQDIEHYLQGIGQKYVTDSTNLETVYKRNKIRHEVLPLLRELNTAVDQSLSQTAQRLTEVEELYNYTINQIKEEICETLSDGILIRWQLLLQKPAQATLLHEWLSPYGFSPATIAQIAEGRQHPTGQLFEAEHYLALFHRGTLEVRKRPVRPTAMPLPSSGEIVLSPHLHLSIEHLSRQQLDAIPKEPGKVALDAASIKGELEIRPYKHSDRFHPYGMKGTKLVSDYLTDRHRSLIDKMSALVITDANGILWLVNERIDQRAAISATTQEIVLLTLNPS